MMSHHQLDGKPQTRRPFFIRSLPFLSAAVVVAASCANIWVALGISGYEHFLRDTNYTSYATPAATFLIHHQSLLLGVALAIPAATVALLFGRRATYTFIAYACLLGLVAFQVAFTVHTILTCQPGWTLSRGLFR
jgi:hypothetical protein